MVVGKLDYKYRDIDILLYNDRGELRTNKCAVVSVAIGPSKQWEVGRLSVIEYCQKYGFPLEIITEPKYNIKPFDTFSNSINLFEKNQVYDLFEIYDRILRLDFDLIITPDCPNLFDLVPTHKIGGVLEDIGIVETDRKRRIMNIQNHLGHLGWESGYLNAGVIVASREHKEVFNTTLKEIERVQSIQGIKTPEQDYLNYMIQKLGFEVFDLGYKFNHICHFPFDRFASYIIHYAGSNVFDLDLQIKKETVKDIEIWREVTSLQMMRDLTEIKKRGLKYQS